MERYWGGKKSSAADKTHKRDVRHSKNLLARAPWRSDRVGNGKRSPYVGDGEDPRRDDSYVTHPAGAGDNGNYPPTKRSSECRRDKRNTHYTNKCREHKYFFKINHIDSIPRRNSCILIVMSIREYLPSAQFTFILGAVALSAGLVFAADYITGRDAREVPGGVAVSTGSQTQDNWLQTLHDIQAQSGTSLPPSPNPEIVSNLLGAAQSENLTNTIGRSIFIKLSDAKAQGLGDDIPTQDTLIADALSQVSQNRGAGVYTVADLNPVTTTPDTLHTYGNAVIAVVQSRPKASYVDTLVAVGRATDNNDPAYLAPLAAIGAEYQAIADELAALFVPQTLAPLHLQVVNNFARMAETYPDMAMVVEDPLRGLSGIQLYQSLVQETERVLTNIAQQLAKNAILFDKSEPGAAWSALLALPQ